MADMTITEFARLGGLARAKKLPQSKIRAIAQKASDAAKLARQRRKRTPKTTRAA